MQNNLDTFNPHNLPDTVDQHIYNNHELMVLPNKAHELIELADDGESHVLYWCVECQRKILMNLGD